MAAYLLTPLVAFGVCEWVSQRLWEKGSIPSYPPELTNVPTGTSDFRIFHVVQDQRELGRILRRNLGPLDPATLFCAGVYGGYRLAEVTGLRRLKWAVRKLNAAVATLTRFRVGTGRAPGRGRRGGSVETATIPAREGRRRPSTDPHGSLLVHPGEAR